MYNKFFGFKEKPFKLVPNPEYLFLSKSHEEALAHLAYAISQGEGFVEITGEVGTGKTTLCRVFLENLDKSIEAAYIFNPKLDALQLLKAINDELGIDSTPDNTKDLIDRLNIFLIEKKAAGHKVLVLIDEAQNLSLEVLEQLRLLSNLETTQEKLLQIILVGQPELGDMLSSYELRQLAQRITINCRLSPLTYDETRDYIRHRIALASHRAGPPFDKASHRAIYEYSRGIPRLINIACDRVLLNAFSRNSFKITGSITKEALRELTRKKPESSYDWLQRPAGLVILSAVFIPLAILLLYLTKGQPPEAPEASKTSPSEQLLQAETGQTAADGAVVPGIAAPAGKPFLAQGGGPTPEQGESQASAQPHELAESPAPPTESSEIIALTGPQSKVPAEPLIAYPDRNINGEKRDIIWHAVHVGSFNSASRARARVAEMKSLGYPSFMYTQEGPSGASVFVVVAGIYQSYGLAKEAGKTLSNAGYRNFIARAKDSLAAGPSVVGQAAFAGQQPLNSQEEENFFNHLQNLNSRFSRNRAMEEILKRWVPAGEIELKQNSIDIDRLFFMEAAREYNLQVEVLAAAADLALIQTLNLPAIFTFYLPGYSWPRYIAAAYMDNEKIYFVDDGQSPTVSVDRKVFLRFWSGEAYIFWKNFKNLPGIVSRNTRGQEVKTLKQLLQQLGYSNVIMTDRYDKNTEQIIKAIQAKYGLETDGRVGPLTKIALYNESIEFTKPSLVKFAAAGKENGS